MCCPAQLATRLPNCATLVPLLSLWALRLNPETPENNSMADSAYLNLLRRPDRCRENYPGWHETVFSIGVFTFNAYGTRPSSEQDTLKWTGA